IKARYVLAFMGFLGMFNVYSLRTNLSVAIVAMVNSSGESDVNSSNVCPDRGQTSSDTANTNGIFDWNSAEQGLVLGCYFYGYIVSNVPGAWLARRYGIRLVLGIAMLLSSIITLFTPLAARSSFALFVALRIILGFFQGVSFPTMQGAWGLWAPPMERSALISAHIAGSSFGTCVTLPVAGGVKRRTPWLSMLTSLPLLAILTGHFASNWGNYTLLTMLPSYMSSILKFDLSTSGFLSSVPYILQFLFTLVGGYITDVIRKRALTSTIVIRKVNTTLGLAIPAAFIVLAGYIGCDVAAAVAFFSISVAFNALTVPGCKANTVDIAPKYGGIIYGMSNTLANIPGFLAPQVVGLILLDGNSVTQWQTVFWISAAIYLTGAIVYLLFGSGEEQSWAAGDI
uniref:Major facilitator superfamily (MFS) profile domain-containing protein n=1 Tax=Ciona savignyi TaxID=51511 RepID=H2ZN02_CIOSA